jgi:hypothetical protein
MWEIALVLMNTGHCQDRSQLLSYPREQAEARLESLLPVIEEQDYLRA